MPVVLKNNASNSLAAAITTADTGIVVRNGNLFPALAAGQYFYATITGADGSQEIVKVTARSGNGMTIVRAQEGTFALPFQLDSRFEMRITAATIADILAEDDLAAAVTIADAGGYYTGGTVEAALQEVGSILTTVPVARGGTGATTADNALVSLAAQKKFAQVRKDVATLLADTTITYTAGTVNSVATGDVVQTAAEGFSYSVAASGASDHHVTTAGGVKLYARATSAGVVNALSFIQSGSPSDPANYVATTAALQKAIDFVSANGGGTLVVPSRFVIDGVTITSPNVSIVGMNRGRLFDTSASGSLVLRAGSSNPLVFIGVGATAGSIRDILLDGNKAAQTVAKAAIEFEATAGGVSLESNWSLENIRILSAKGDGILQGVARRGMRFSAVMIYGCEGRGIYAGGSDNTFEGCLIGGCTSNGLHLANWTQKVIGGDFWDNATGVFVDAGTRYISIVGANLDRNRGSAIYFNDSGTLPAYVSVTGCAFHESSINGSTSPIIYLGANYATIVGCTFGPQNDASAPTKNYCIFVPTATTANTHDIIGNNQNNAASAGLLYYRGATANEHIVSGRWSHVGTRVGFYGSTPVTKQAVTGRRASALNSLMTAMAAMGLVVNSTTAVDDGFDLMLQQVTAANTGGGSSVVGLQDRSFGTTITSRIGSNITSTSFDLPAGTYRIQASAPAYNVGSHRIVVRNDTDGVDLAEGTTQFCGSASNVQTVSTVDRVVTLAATKTIKLRHYTELAVANDGLGKAAAALSGRFAEIRVWRLD